MTTTRRGGGGHVRPLAAFTHTDHHRQTFGGRNRWAPCLCVRINRIIGTVTAASGRRGSAGWHSFRPPAGARVNGPNGSTQSAYARDQLLADYRALGDRIGRPRPRRDRTPLRMREILFAYRNDE